VTPDLSNDKYLVKTNTTTTEEMSQKKQNREHVAKAFRTVFHRPTQTTGE
jgi:hypothetical protein